MYGRSESKIYYEVLCHISILCCSVLDCNNKLKRMRYCNLLLYVRKEYNVLRRCNKCVYVCGDDFYLGTNYHYYCNMKKRNLIGENYGESKT